MRIYRILHAQIECAFTLKLFVKNGIFYDFGGLNFSVFIVGFSIVVIVIIIA